MFLISDRREFLYVTSSTALEKKLESVQWKLYWEKIALNGSGEGSKTKGFH